jgi:hypothetical protein
MNRQVSFIIRALKEDPLSTGMLDVFFRKYRIMCIFYKESFIYLKFAVIFNSFYSNHSGSGLQFDSIIGNVLSLRQSPSLDLTVDYVGRMPLKMMEFSAYSLHGCALNS